MLAVLLVCALSTSQNFDQWYSDRYNLVHKVPLPYVYGWDVLDLMGVKQLLEPTQGVVWTLGTNKVGEVLLFEIRNKTQLVPVQGLPPFATVSRVLFDTQRNVLTAVSGSSLTRYTCTTSPSKCTKEVAAVTVPPVTAMEEGVYKGKTGLLIGTGKGAFFLPDEGAKLDSIHNITDPILSIATISGIAAVGTPSKLYLYFTKEDIWKYDYCASYVDNTTTMGWRQTDRTLWIGSATGLNVIEFDSSDAYSIWRVGFLEGLPVANFTTSAISKQGRVWFGGTLGVATYEGNLQTIIPSLESSHQPWDGLGQVASERTPWRYLNNQRWLPYGPVTAMLTLESGEMVIATTYGLARIFWHSNYTLAAKASVYEDIVLQRHNRFGMVDDVGLARSGDLSSFEYRPSDNDGLWTNTYLASQCYRYKISADPAAKQAAWRSFVALERLYKVTPPERWGLMARSVVPRGTPTGSGTWHNSTTPGYTNWTWKGDTSSDEVIGYYYALPLFHDYVCETADERARVMNMLLGTVDYIMANNWYLIDVTGKPTTWGFWNPSQLNDNPVHYSERCLNSLEIISMLSVAYHYTKNESYLTAIDYLGVSNGYLGNLVNWRIEYPEDQDYSDDELGFYAMGAFFYVRASIPQKYAVYYDKALGRSWRLVAAHKSCIWTYMVQLWQGGVDPGLLASAEEQLVQWSLEWVDWTVANSQRRDIVINAQAARDSNSYSVDLLRQDERAMTQRWNGNVYQLDTAGQGMSEHDPSAYLLPYYISVLLNSK